MAPLKSFSGIVAILLATSTSAFVVPSPNQTPLQRSQSAFVPTSASAAPGLRSTRDLGVGTTRLSFSTQPNADDEGVVAGGGKDKARSVVYPARQTAAGPLKAVSGGAGVGEEGGGNDFTGARRAVVLAIWLLFAGYAFGPWSPGAALDPADAEIVTHLYGGAVAPQADVFYNVFNGLGVLPAIMASMLVGGGSLQKGRQPVPPLPFVFGAFALGFFSVGPYLALRNYLPEREEDEEMSGVEKALTSKVLAVPLLALSAFLLVSVASALADPEAVSRFSELFGSSKLVHISTLDFCVLNAVIIDPIREDMRRRGVEPEPAKVALFAVPLVGPALWMLVRPPVES